MPRSLCAAALCASSLLLPLTSSAATDAELAEIREQIRQLKDSYEARLRALEDRLKAAEAAAVPPPASIAPAATAAAPPAGSYAASLLAAFNPGIAVVLQGNYQNLKQDPDLYGFNNIVIGDEVTPGRRGLGIAETELTFFASVDPLFAGSLTLALTPENEVEVEEAYGVATAVPFGIVPKFGRFFSGVGYLNEQHQHAWDFQDAPLPYQAFFANQFSQDGLQLKWVAPTDVFLEIGGEVGNGDAFPGSPRNSNGAGAWSGFAHAGGDIGSSSSWRAGISYLRTKAAERMGKLPDTAGIIAQTSFAGDSRTTIADFVWKYAPHGNPRDSSFKLQGEYFWQRTSGDLTYDSDGSLGLTQTAAYSASQRGWYLQGIWQFMPAWRLGLRYDRLSPGTPEYGANAEFLATEAFSPRRTTVMIDWTPSEFSRIRLQYAQNRERPEFTDDQFFIQYILTLGAHRAHKY